MEKLRNVPLSGFIVAPSVTLNFGDCWLMSVESFTYKVTLSLEITGSRIRMLLSTWHDVISASLLRASSEIQEKKSHRCKKAYGY